MWVFFLLPSTRCKEFCTISIYFTKDVKRYYFKHLNTSNNNEFSVLHVRDIFEIDSNNLHIPWFKNCWNYVMLVQNKIWTENINCNCIYTLNIYQLIRITEVRTRNILLRNRCQTRPVSGVSFVRATNALSVIVFLLPLAICLITFSASLNFPREIYHLGDSGIIL